MRGKKAVGIFRAKIEDEKGHCHTRRAGAASAKNAARRCGCSIREWPELVHPFASAIDTRLPVPPSKVHLMLKFKAPWVKPDFGRGDAKFREYPKLSIEEWHKKRGSDGVAA